MESFDQLEAKYFTFVNDCDDPDISLNVTNEETKENISYDVENQNQTQVIQESFASHSGRWDHKPCLPCDNDEDLQKYKDAIRNRRKLVPSSNQASPSPVASAWDGKYQRYSTSCISPNKKRKTEQTYTRKSFPPSYGNRGRNAEELPSYKGYQLLGDSQLVRFSEQLLGLRRSVTYTQDTNSRRIGYCVSGQKIRDLKERISKRELPLSEKVILLIGTNDMIYGTNLQSMYEDYNLILDTLRQKASKIVLLTVPPVPKLAHIPTHMGKLRQFNEFVMSCADDKQIFAVDFGSLFISYTNTVSTQFFEEVYGNRRRSNSAPRIDLIHLNRSGFKLLSSILDIQYFDKICINV